jgi:hypothetical protein
MLWIIPFTILITWIYNCTGSLLTAILMHTAANFSFNAFPLLPEMTASGGVTTFWIFLGVVWVVTIAVIIVFGPTHLSRGRHRATIGGGTEMEMATTVSSTDRSGVSVAVAE